MIDIHNHIVYGVDDGSRSIDESLAMVDLYMKSGFSEIIATSHFDRSRYMVDASEIRDKVSILNEKIKEKGLDFKIYPGHEIQVEVGMEKKLASGELLRLNDTRYVLCELSFVNKPNFLKDLFYNLQLDGYVPIIAHAERYPYVARDIDWLIDFIKMGALIQVNYSSIKSNYETIKSLLERNMVHLIATDAHQSGWRNPYINEYKEEILKIVSEDKFYKLSTSNPSLVLRDQFIPSEHEKILINNKKEKRSIFSFWRRR